MGKLFIPIYGQYDFISYYIESRVIGVYYNIHDAISNTIKTVAHDLDLYDYKLNKVIETWDDLFTFIRKYDKRELFSKKWIIKLEIFDELTKYLIKLRINHELIFLDFVEKINNIYPKLFITNQLFYVNFV